MLRCLIIAILAVAALALTAPAPMNTAEAEIILAKAKHLEPPKGRVRKRLMHPSIAPPSSGHKRRIIRRQAFRWFWGKVSTSRAAASSARWSQVMTVIESGRSQGKAVFGTRATAQRILNAYRETLIKESKRRNVSLPLLIAVITVESNGRSAAVSPKGAGGLMQLMPGTASRFGVTDRFQPSQNIRGGATYLDWLLKRFKGDAVLALAGYNAGEGAVDQHGGVPPYAETRDYVAMVAGAFAAARHLCASPPLSPRGTCDLK